MKASFTLLCLLLSLCGAAQTPTLFADQYPGTGRRYGVLNLDFGATRNGDLFFNIYDSATNRATLHITDGTVAGTFPLKTTPIYTSYWTFGANLYFGFNDTATGGPQLWKTDGTVAGTLLVKTFGRNTPYGRPAEFANVGGKMLFTTSDSSNPGIRKMYVSDGTAAGTLPLKPGLYDCDYDHAYLNGELLFSASANVDSPSQKELYITDGTAAGTVLVKDINPGAPGSRPYGFVSFQNEVYFFATTAASGMAIWKTNGTAAGTMLAVDLMAAGISNAGGMVAYQNKIYFSGKTSAAGQELFVTDGTQAGTQLLLDINPGTQSSYASGFIVVGATLLFQANDGTHGSEFWKTDGTAAGTVLLKDINPGGATGLYGVRTENQVCENRFYFDAAADSFNIEPWVTDGTAAGTVSLGEINPGPASSLDGETYYKKAGNRVYFAAYSFATGNELYYVTDSCVPTGITPVLSQNSAVTLYPNPASGSVTLSLAGALPGAAIRFSNVLGAVVKMAQTTGNVTEIPIRDLPAGFYTVTIETRTGKETRKLVVQ